MKVYILMYKEWNGNSYDNEIEEIYKDKRQAERYKKIYQHKFDPDDIEWFIEEYEII